MHFFLHLTHLLFLYFFSGTHYDVAKDTLLKFEDTMLAKLVSDKWNQNSHEAIFIDRDGERFKYILDWYRDGKITVPKIVSIDAIKSEAEYFGLGDIIIEQPNSLGVSYEHYYTINMITE